MNDYFFLSNKHTFYKTETIITIWFCLYTLNCPGHLEHTYEARHTNEGLQFDRRHQSSHNVHREHTKVTLYCSVQSYR